MAEQKLDMFIVPKGTQIAIQGIPFRTAEDVTLEGLLSNLELVKERLSKQNG